VPGFEAVEQSHQRPKPHKVNWTRAFALVNYEQAVEPSFESTA
jgi:hypothetical protein